MVIETERAEIEARGAGHRAHAPAADRGPRHPPGRAAVALGLRRRRRPATAPTTSARCGSDPNVSIQEDKAFTCNVRAGRRTGETTARARQGVHAASHAEPGGDAPPRTPRTHDRDRRQAAGRRADGLLHRHDGVHRLQGVRGRLQAVERPALRRRHVPQGRLATTPRGACRATRGATCASSSSPTPAAASRGGDPGPRGHGGRRTARRSTSRPPWRRSTTGSSCPTSASTARTRAASTRARRAR